MDADRVATRGPTRPDSHRDPGPDTVNATLRTEALRQLRWQQREWTRILATDAPHLIAAAARAGFSDGLDVLRKAGEDIPSWLYERASLVETGGATARLRLTVLLANLTMALAWFDPEPPAWDPGGLVVHHPDPTLPGAEQAESARGEGASRQGDHDAPAVAWKPTDEGHDAAGNSTIGDRVTARATAITVRAGRCGTVVGFSGVGGHPLVDFDGAGRVLIRAEHLRAEHRECDDGAPTGARSADRPRSSGTTRLSATPRPPAGEVASLAPPPDWFDRQPPPPR